MTPQVRSRTEYLLLIHSIPALILRSNFRGGI